MHLVLCLVGLPLLPLDLGPARGWECFWAFVWRGRARSLVSFSFGGGGAGVARSRQMSLSRVSESVDSPQFSPHVPRRSALYPPAIHTLRGVNRGRIRGLGLERVALVGVAVAPALAPFPVRGQEGVSVGGGHRPRHALLVVAHAVSGRGLLTATALDVEVLGRVVTGLDPRIDTGHAVTALDVSGRSLLTATALVVSVRVPLPVGGSGAIARDRTLPRIARMTARGQASDYLLLLPACGLMMQDDCPDEEPRRVWRRLPPSLLWLLERRWMLLLLQEGRPCPPSRLLCGSLPDSF